MHTPRLLTMYVKQGDVVAVIVVDRCRCCLVRVLGLLQLRRGLA